MFPCHTWVARFAMAVLRALRQVVLSVASVLVIFHDFRSSLMTSLQDFFGCPQLRLPFTSWCITLLIQPSLRSTWPCQRRRLYLSVDSRLLMFSFWRRESELILSSRRTLQIHRIIALSFLCILKKTCLVGAQHSLACSIALRT